MDVQLRIRRFNPETDNEPHCVVEGVRRVVDGEVRLHLNRVVVGK